MQLARDVAALLLLGGHQPARQLPALPVALAERFLSALALLDERREQQRNRDRHEEDHQRDGIVGPERCDGWHFTLYPR